jgi:hypothetical protein
LLKFDDRHCSILLGAGNGPGTDGGTDLRAADTGTDDDLSERYDSAARLADACGTLPDWE